MLAEYQKYKDMKEKFENHCTHDANWTPEPEPMSEDQQ